MRDICKAWPGVVANDHVNLAVRKGEIHALVGENGAGKSTLMNILYGLVHPDSGEIFINGQLVHIGGPRDAIRLKIGMVHQHFMLIPPLTVAENIVLGHEPGEEGLVGHHEVALGDHGPADAAAHGGEDFREAEVQPGLLHVHARITGQRRIHKTADSINARTPASVLDTLMRRNPDNMRRYPTPSHVPAVRNPPTADRAGRCHADAEPPGPAEQPDTRDADRVE